MKIQKLLLNTLLAFAFNTMIAMIAALVCGFDMIVCVIIANGIALLLGFVPLKGCLRVGVLKEVWTGEMVKSLRAGLEASWLDGIPDSSALVDSDVIHLVDVGVDPDVIVNNKTYPIPVQALTDGDIAISLDKFQTNVTPITDDELYAASYNKMNRVKESHANAINNAKFAKAAHAMTPSENAKDTPVLKTTGAYVDGTSGRKRITLNDIIALKDAFDKKMVPVQGRRLVLCSDHVNDLLLIDQHFKEQYYNFTTGKIANMYGFEVFEFANNPLFTVAGKKKAVGATASGGEYQASFAFYTQRTFKATGSTKMYYSAADTDPEYQRNKINFRHMFICMPKKADAVGAIMSDYTAPKA